MHWWELYYKKAVALVNDNRSVWKEFIEATKVLLSFKTLREGEFEIALYTLWQMHKKTSKTVKMSFVLECLAYRRESNK